MVNYNEFEVNQKIIEFCRFPIPRTASEIIKFLKKEVKNYYPKSRPDLIVSFLRKNHLDELVAKNILVEYSIKDPNWKNTRALMKHFYTNQGITPPRKVSSLYQINFLYLQHTPNIYHLPVFKDINLELITLFYPLIKDKKIPNFFWEVLNFLLSYEKERDKIKIAMHQLNFSEKERDLLEKFAGYSGEFNSLFQTFPFKPDSDKAIEFMRML
jgi:hypothetical protein